MTLSSLLKTSLTSLITMTLLACSNLQQPSSGVLSSQEVVQQNISSQLAHSLQHEEWLANEYRIYLSKTGYKAFAVYWDDQGIPRATGYADDKISAQLARKEALRLCNAYVQSHTHSKCHIEDEANTDRTLLDPKAYPNEVIAYRDVEHWQEYLAEPGHKAIAGNQSGILGGSEGKTKAEAENKALTQCYDHTHFSVPTCYIIASE